uniref:5-oxoprolinase, ATP-hydrolysing n=1 Tax=Ursus maritimus TaxID=29073 RepID=A0A452V620_URSMA
MGGPEGRFHFAVDRGGTFTDVFAQCPGGHVRVLKLLSEDPANYVDAPTEGIRRILEQEGGVPLPRDRPLDTSRIASIRMGTTVATNALLERRGERVALLVTRGFRDLLHVGTQAREDLFDLAVPMPEVLYEEVLEVDERVVLYRGDRPSRAFDRVVTGFLAGRTGDLLEVQQPVDLGGLRGKLEGLLSRGIRSLAVVLMHSYAWAQHEQQVGALAQELGFTHVSLSSEAMPMVRIVPRGHTACADAYLTPTIQRYVQGFRRGFQGQLKDVQVLFMRSDGGLAPMDSFSGSRAVLSGPAGGVVGYAATTYRVEGGQPVIGFDMGGTSTDVSRYAGEFEHVFEASTAGVTLQAPQLDINTVGPRLFFRSGLFVVGPESAGAHPGPACYRKGGPVTVTDANLVLGRLLPASFPCIFGPGEDQPLSPEASRKDLEAVATEVNSFLTNGPCPASPLSLEEVAMGFVRVANEAMCRPIRALTQVRLPSHVLACFGGAGGQHACAIARALGMDTVHIHRHSGLLSALGLALADVVHEAQEPCSLPYAPETFVQLDQRLSRLEEQCVDALRTQGFPRSQISTESFLHLRYQGTDCALMVSAHRHPATARSPRAGDFGAAFVERYANSVSWERWWGACQPGHLALRVLSGPVDIQMTQCYFEGGYQETPVYLLGELGYGHKLQGPCLIIDSNSTILVEPGCQAEVTETGDIRISVGAEAPSTVGAQLDPIHLSIFSHRFMSIAEQMGRILQRTAISTNIKERLDFSCALFGPDGGLVSNAPHIPVHLGAMQETVQFQVFWPGQARPVFYVASRGHHADIGGITPGSMPPHSTTLQQEGAVFLSFKLVQGGVFQEEAVTEALRAPGKIPGCSGTRNLHDNLSDLRAQVAANQKGIQLVGELIGQYGLDVVQAYMGHIQANAELAVRDMLRAFGTSRQARGLPLEVSAEDHMDDGSPIRLRVQINLSQGSAVFDFSGTGPEVFGNLNAPRAITLSALIYSLRCLVGRDIPLNQGCLAPVRVVIPRGSILDPSPEAAVVGGNVLTSQRVVDVILGAFGACAASQVRRLGGHARACWGGGAGWTWAGASQCHQMNMGLPSSCASWLRQESSSSASVSMLGCTVSTSTRCRKSMV